ncbi:MAG: TIGR02117 family protein [Rhizobacter sp.]
MTWRTPFRVVGLSLLGLVAVVVAYLGTAFGLALIPGRPAPSSDNTEAYVVSNGVHTDLVLPVRGGPVDWTTVFPPSHFPSMPSDAAYVAVGWGDREFYLNTPEWRDLTASRAVGALSGRGRTLLHVTWLRPGELGRRAWRLPLDTAGHEALARHIRTSLAADDEGRAVPVAGAHYGRVDAFFEAKGAYDLFTTCNTWTGRALREAGVPVGPWTPFAPNVVWHLMPLGATAPGTATRVGHRDSAASPPG